MVTETTNCKKYGVPLYGAAWAPAAAFRSDTKRDDVDGSPPSISTENYVVLAGGGGEGRSGIPNAILVSRFDSDSNSLSDEPVAKLVTGADLPYRMAVHPGGDRIICSLPKSCRQFEWEAIRRENGHELNLRASDKVLTQLEDIGQQLALTFSNNGSLLALGGEDGKLKVFKWPNMDIVIDEDKAHSSVKDLDFSSDGKFLVSVGSGGPGRVWDVTSSKPVASLTKDRDEAVGFCRFSHSSDNKPVLYTTSVRDEAASIVKWDTSSWKRMSSKFIVRQSISAFAVSADGKFLAMGTVQGDVVIVNSSSMRVHNTVKKAHLGIVTALKFSEDSRALVSASLDSSVRVTQIKDVESGKGFSFWIIILIVLIAIAVYYMKTKGILP